jgi:pimeloyl-ACP methyl ester carboxylesterase
MLFRIFLMLGLFSACLPNAWADAGTVTSEVRQFACAACRGGSFYVSFPEGYYDPANAGRYYPTIIFVHGHGEGYAANDSVAARIAKLSATGPLKSGNRYLLNGKQIATIGGSPKQYEFIILAPQVSINDGGLEYVNGNGSSNNTWLLSTYNSALQQAFRVDVDRVYVTGLSQGGGASWRSIVKYPDLFAGAVVAAGQYDLALDICRAAGVPVWALHGNLDNSVNSFTKGQQTFNRYAACPEPDIGRFTVFPGGGHNSTVWNSIYDTINDTVDADGNHTLDLPNTTEVEGTTIYEWMLDHSLGPVIVPPVNVALGAAASASSTYPGGAYPAAKAVDGSLSNADRWLSGNFSGPHTLTLDLGAAYSMTEATVHSGFNNDFAIASFSIEALSGSNWLPIAGASITGNTQTTVHLVFDTPVTATSIRFVATDPSVARLKEIEVMGIPADD